MELELVSAEEACLGIEPQGETCITPCVETTGSVFFKGQLTTYVVHDQKIYVEINMFPFIRDHINHRSYHFMDSCLVRAGLVPQACYITTSQTFKRSHIHTKALLLLLKKSFRHHKLDCEMAIAAIADLKDDITLSLVSSQTPSNGAKNRISNVNKLSKIINEEFHSKTTSWKPQHI